MVETAFAEFLAGLNLPPSKTGVATLQVNVAVKSAATTLLLGTDESYTLSMNGGARVVKIESSTYFGARHALETLSQLIVTPGGKEEKVLVRSGISITDKPAYPYRGVMLDTARNFLPIATIKGTIDAMSWNKLNTLHLHLTDTSSFPLEIIKQPNLTSYGAFAADEYYKQEDISALVDYALLRGVRLVPEMDQPAHAREGWQWTAEAGLGRMTSCTSPDGTNNPGAEWELAHALEPVSGQLNAANPHLMAILDDVVEGVVGAFKKPPLYHLGGDEVMVGDATTWASCWGTDPDIIKDVLLHSADKGEKLLPGWTRMKDAALIKAVNVSNVDWNDGFYGLWKRFTMNVTKLVTKQYAQHDDGPLEKLVQWGGQATGAGTVLFNLFSQEDVTEVLPPSQFMIQVWDNNSLSLILPLSLTCSPSPHHSMIQVWDKVFSRNDSNPADNGYFSNGHTWAGSIAPELMHKGYDVILSHVDFAYLDCGGTAPEHAEYDAPWGGYWCPLVEWFSVYDYVPQFLHAAREAVAKGDAPAFDASHIKGAEVTAWGETIGESNLAAKLWPRAAALAEGLWTNRSTGKAEEAHFSGWYGAGNGSTADRLVYHSHQMSKRGVHGSIMQPRWCLLNPGNCYVRPSPPPARTPPSNSSDGQQRRRT
jgi:N-acetyl-beta-hexosaminidase